MTRAQRTAINAMLLAEPVGLLAGSVEEMRRGFAETMSRFPVPPARLRAITIGGVSALEVTPVDRSPAGTLLYFHGGAFCIGSPTTALGLTASLVARTGLRALSLDYRLAPEHPFPAAIDDGVAAYRALLELGTDPGSIAFAGDSAGGGLSVTTTLSARDRGLPVPAAVVAFSPALDHTRSGASVDAKAGRDPYFTRESLDAAAKPYLAGQDPHQPLLAPAVLADMTGFPPLLLQVGTNELLLDDAARLAERARDYEVDVILDITADVPHVFQSFSGQLDEADLALDRAALFLTQNLR